MTSALLESRKLISLCFTLHVLEKIPIESKTIQIQILQQHKLVKFDVRKQGISSDIWY